jgi:hypothetical protein
MTCRLDPTGGNSHTPHLRGCIEGKNAKTGGNPVGTAFTFESGSGTITNNNCKEEANTCVAVDMAADPAFSIADCKDARATGWTKANGIAFAL